VQFYELSKEMFPETEDIVEKLPMPSTQYKIYLDILKVNTEKIKNLKESQQSKKKKKQEPVPTNETVDLDDKDLEDIFFTQTLQACVIAKPSDQVTLSLCL